MTPIITVIITALMIVMLRTIMEKSFVRDFPFYSIMFYFMSKYPLTEYERITFLILRVLIYVAGIILFLKRFIERTVDKKINDKL